MFNYNVTATITTFGPRRRRRRSLNLPLNMMMGNKNKNHFFNNKIALKNQQRKKTTREPCGTRPLPLVKSIRPPIPIWAPEVVHVIKENCTDDFADLFCLNGGTCHREKEEFGYSFSCLCPAGLFGRRCEFRDSGSGGNDLRLFQPLVQPAPRNHRAVREASVSGAACLLITLTFLVAVAQALYKRWRRHKNPIDHKNCFVGQRRPTLSILPTTMVDLRRQRRRTSLSIEDELESDRQIPAEYVL